MSKRDWSKLENYTKWFNIPGDVNMYVLGVSRYTTVSAVERISVAAEAVVGIYNGSSVVDVTKLNVIDVRIIIDINNEINRTSVIMEENILFRGNKITIGYLDNID